MDKCLVKGCKNHRTDGAFVGDLCMPCHSMLTEGKLMPSDAWFVEECHRLVARGGRLVANGLAEFLQTWRDLPEIVGYVKPSFDIWLANQLQRMNAAGSWPVVAEDADAWQPMASAPRDGTLVDLWTVRGTRVSNVSFVRAEQVNPKYAKGGVWEHLAQDGWRLSVTQDACLQEDQFTHWKHITGPNGQRHPQG